MELSANDDGCKWYAITTSLAYVLVGLTQTLPIIFNTSHFRAAYEGLGAPMAGSTAFVLGYNIPVSACIIVASILSCIFVMAGSNKGRLARRASYLSSLAALISAFAWAEFVKMVVYYPLFQTGSVIG